MQVLLTGMNALSFRGAINGIAPGFQICLGTNARMVITPSDRGQRFIRIQSSKAESARRRVSARLEKDLSVEAGTDRLPVTGGRSPAPERRPKDQCDRENNFQTAATFRDISLKPSWAGCSTPGANILRPIGCARGAAPRVRAARRPRKSDISPPFPDTRAAAAGSRKEFPVHSSRKLAPEHAHHAAAVWQGRLF